MKQSRILKVLLTLFTVSLLFYAIGMLINSSHQKEKSMLSSKQITTKSQMISVGVVNPTPVNSGTISETTYLGEVLSEKNGKIFAYRNGIVEKFLVDVGSSVKEGQAVAKLLPAEFNPDLANMIVEKKMMKIKATGMLESAQLTLQAALDRKTKIGKSTQTQVETVVGEQVAKVEKMQANLDALNTEIGIQQKKIENMKKKTNAGISLEDSKLKNAAGNIKSSIKNAYNTIIRIFYASNYNQNGNPSSFNGNIYFGAKDTNIRNTFANSISFMYPRMKTIDTLSQDDMFVLAKDMLGIVDGGLKVLDNTILSSEYGETMLNSDKTMLIMAKTDAMNGIQTNLNMYNEQLSMLAKETNMAGADVSDEILMLEKLSAEKNVMEKDLAMAIAEQKKMSAETQNDQVMTENEADKMVTEAQKMVIDAKTDLQSANVGLSLFQSSGFSNEIRAPFSGKITKRYINIGESIGMNSPTFDIVQSKNTADFFVRFEIPESEFSKVKIGQGVSFFKTIEPLKKYSAVIKRVAPAINTASKGVIVEAIIEGNESQSALIGSSIRVTLMQPNTLYSIPTKAVKQDEDGNMYIFKVLKNKIQKQIINTARTYGDQVFVTDGLKVGTKVVVEDGGIQLEEGMDVTYIFTETVQPDAKPAELVDPHKGMKM